MAEVFTKVRVEGGFTSARREYPSQAGAWLASARVAANGGPVDLEVKRRRVDGRTFYVLLAATPGDADRADAVLVRFDPSDAIDEAIAHGVPQAQADALDFELRPSARLAAALEEADRRGVGGSWIEAFKEAYRGEPEEADEPSQ